MAEDVLGICIVLMEYGNCDCIPVAFVVAVAVVMAPCTTVDMRLTLASWCIFIMVLAGKSLTELLTSSNPLGLDQPDTADADPFSSAMLKAVFQPGAPVDVLLELNQQAAEHAQQMKLWGTEVSLPRLEQGPPCWACLCLTVCRGAVACPHHLCPCG